METNACRDTLKPNDFVTANNVWKALFNPVTTNTILTGNLNLMRTRYFDNIVKRKNKIGKSMNDFHSFIKKKLLLENIGGKKRLLDIGVGKAGDLNHWIDAGCEMVVGLDSIKDNLDNANNGACNRLLNKYISDNTQPKNKNVVKTILDNTLMIWGDCSKTIFDSSAAKDDLSKYYLQILYGLIPKTTIKNNKLKGFHNCGNDFDLVVSNFAIHYFFENEESLNNIAKNISNSLRSGGKFVATTLNGEKVFNSLRYNDFVSSEALMWKITKKYNSEVFPENEKGLGMKIEIYVDSIGQALDEFLVHPKYFEKVMSNYGLKLIKTIDFEETFIKESALNTNYGNMLAMENDLKTYSFMNIGLVFEKE